MLPRARASRFVGGSCSAEVAADEMQSVGLDCFLIHAPFCAHLAVLCRSRVAVFRRFDLAVSFSRLAVSSFLRLAVSFRFAVSSILRLAVSRGQFNLRLCAWFRLIL